MLNFKDPFQGIVERKMTTEKLIRELRHDISGELEAIFINDARAQATDDLIAKKVINNICNEDNAYIGDLMTLLRDLDPHGKDFLVSDEAKTKEMLVKFDYRGLNSLWKVWAQEKVPQQVARYS